MRSRKSEPDVPLSTRDLPLTLLRRGEGPAPLAFKQGARQPYGIRWYGITSLYGHWRSFVSRWIATESVDTRDWMRPNVPQDLLRAAAKVLGGNAEGRTLTESLSRPVWIDFVADTGDDHDVSAAVGRMVIGSYAFEGNLLPRGDVLIFGGDVAYPVATADEIYKRLVSPWNEGLRTLRASNERRVLLGVPGNHDWYDGLDGFGRLFRRRVDEPFRADDHEPGSRLTRRLQKGRGRKLGLVARGLHLDEVGHALGLFARIYRSFSAFFRGVGLKRRRRIVLRGYEPLQEASYFILPIAPGLDLFGADRQLGRVDFRQRSFFTRWRSAHPDARVLFVAGDPATAYGVRNEPGARMLASCKLSLRHDPVLYIAGDFHHYERSEVGRSMHVIAGGGGAFLHGTRISPYPEVQPSKVYPDGRTSRRLLAGVPLKLTFGRSGFVVHLTLALLASIQMAAFRSSTAALVGTAAAMALLLWLVLYLIAGHQGSNPRRIALVAAPFGIGMGLLPMVLRLSLPGLGLAGDGFVLALSAFLGTLVFGFFLSTCAILGLEHQQAFTVLGHPGFKHFVRLRIDPTGSIEAWVIGKDDMLVKGPPTLIDHFTWAPSPASEGAVEREEPEGSDGEPEESGEPEEFETPEPESTAQ